MEAFSPYGAFARSRVRDLPTRIGFALFLAGAAWVLSSAGPALFWLAAVSAAQALDTVVATPILRRPEIDPPLWRKRLYAVSIGVNALIYSSISVYFWFGCGDVGKAFAMLQPAGSLLNISLQLEKSPRALIAAWVPHCCYLMGIPIVAGFIGHDFARMGVMTIGSLVYVVHVVAAVRAMDRNSRNLQAARDLAEDQRERAVAASAAKSDFLAVMSHEIRTPMNGVVAAAALLRKTPLNKDQAEHVEMLASSSEVLMGLLGDILDLSKIESGKLVVERASFDLTRKLEAAARLWRPQAEAKGVALELDIDDAPHRILTDPLRFQQVLFNLLSNAVKFTDEGVVRLRCYAEGERLVAEVEDSGCGMDGETAERVFRTFEQAHAGVARQYGGAGLGLAISRRLAELLGGELSVESAPGRGSIFRFETPLVDAGPAIIPPHPREAPRAGGRHAGTVLLVEDHEVNRRIVRLFLEPLGFEVTPAENGRDAVDLAGARAFDVILMDMQMPVMGGIEASTRIRDGRGPNHLTPIIALTANALDEHRAEWAAIGVELFMTKPVNPQALIETIARAVAAAPEALVKTRKPAA
ncbi:MAG TPA: ATP-binding protein [Caulobacteraceae bacterium]|jgi:signal transduction histidine kinase/CheY-like chemotaxis protein|nr:ATP-binding protein [Caulobacteraceae bacterium]